MESDRDMFGRTFTIDSALAELQLANGDPNEQGLLAQNLATAFAHLVATKFRTAQTTVKHDLRTLTVNAMLMERDMHSRGRTFDKRSHTDDREFREKHYAAINTTLQTVGTMLNTFSSYADTTAVVKRRWYVETEQVESFYAKYDTPVFLRDVGFHDLTQLQYNPAMLKPPREIAPALQHVKSENGQAWLDFWIFVLRRLRCSAPAPAPDSAAFEALLANNVKCTAIAGLYDTSKDPCRVGGITSAALSDTTCPVWVVPTMDDSNASGDVASQYKPMVLRSWAEVTFAQVLTLLYALFNTFTAAFDDAAWRAVSVDAAIRWLDDITAKGTRLKFTSPAENDALRFVIARDELGALRLTPLPQAMLRAKFIRERLKNLVKALVQIKTMKDCASPPRPIESTSRYSIETVLVQMIYGVARNPSLYAESHINFLLMGDAGAGKTFFAGIIASIMKNCGLLISQNPVDVVSKPDLVGDAIGKTAPKTKQRLIRDLQNVMFIDEAYTLTQPDTSKEQKEGMPQWESFGFEAVGELINFLDKNKGNIAVIAAGYEHDMRSTFLKINEGMPRRFPFQIVLPNYSPVELTGLFCKFMSEKTALSEPFMTPVALDYFTQLLEADMAQPKATLFPNSAGDVENFMAIAAQSLASQRQAPGEAQYAFDPTNIYDLIQEYARTTGGRAMPPGFEREPPRVIPPAAAAAAAAAAASGDAAMAGGARASASASGTSSWLEGGAGLTAEQFEKMFPNMTSNLTDVIDKLQTETDPLPANLAAAFATVVASKFEVARQNVRQTLRQVLRDASLFTQDLITQHLEIKDADVDAFEKFPQIEEGLATLSSTYLMFEPFVDFPELHVWNQQVTPPKDDIEALSSENKPLFDRMVTMESYYKPHQVPTFLRDIGVTEFTQFQFADKVLKPPDELGLLPLMLQKNASLDQLLRYWMEVVKHVRRPEHREWMSQTLVDVFGDRDNSQQLMFAGVQGQVDEQAAAVHGAEDAFAQAAAEAAGDGPRTTDRTLALAAAKLAPDNKNPCFVINQPVPSQLTAAGAGLLLQYTKCLNESPVFVKLSSMLSDCATATAAERVTAQRVALVTFHAIPSKPDICAGLVQLKQTALDNIAEKLGQMQRRRGIPVSVLQNIATAFRNVVSQVEVYGFTLVNTIKSRPMWRGDENMMRAASILQNVVTTIVTCSYPTVDEAARGVDVVALSVKNIPFPPDNVTMEPMVLWEKWKTPHTGHQIIADFVNSNARRGLDADELPPPLGFVAQTAGRAANQLNWSDLTFNDMMLLIYALFNLDLDSDDLGLDRPEVLQAAAVWFDEHVVRQSAPLRFTTAAEDAALRFLIQRPELAVLKLQGLKSENTMKQIFAHSRLPKLIENLQEVSSLTKCEDCTRLVSTSRFEVEALLARFVQSMAISPTSLSKSHLNVILMGPAGSGKTRYAELIGNVLKNMGLLISRAPVDIISRSELVGQYLGETAPMTKARLIKNRENVVFLDEAYTLTQKDSKGDWDPYGFEAVGEIINFLDKNKGTICFIAAGYEGQMTNNFLAINQGQTRRFPNQVLLPDYSSDELVALLCYFINKFMGTTKCDKRTNAVVPGWTSVLTPAAMRFLVALLADDGDRKTLFPNSAGDMENFGSLAARLLSYRRSGAGDGAYALEPGDLMNIIKVYCVNTKNKVCTVRQGLRPEAQRPAKREERRRQANLAVIAQRVARGRGQDEDAAAAAAAAAAPAPAPSAWSRFVGTFKRESGGEAAGAQSKRPRYERLAGRSLVGDEASSEALSEVSSEVSSESSVSWEGSESSEDEASSEYEAGEEEKSEVGGGGVRVRAMGKRTALPMLFTRLCV
jgi:AAA+ superfamily predicted ATPase